MAYFLNDMPSHILSIYNWHHLNLFHHATFNKIYLHICLDSFHFYSFFLAFYASAFCSLGTFTISAPVQQCHVLAIFLNKAGHTMSFSFFLVDVYFSLNTHVRYRSEKKNRKKRQYFPSTNNTKQRFKIIETDRHNKTIKFLFRFLIQLLAVN